MHKSGDDLLLFVIFKSKSCRAGPQWPSALASSASNHIPKSGTVVLGAIDT